MADAIDPPLPPISRPYLEFRPMLRALGIASDAKKLILAVAGLVALYLGWWMLASAFSGAGLADGSALPLSMFEEFPELSTMGPFDAVGHVTSPFRTLVTPVAALFTRGLGPSGWFRSLLMAVWTVTVWGIVGGAIARIAVVQAAGESRVGLGSALRFALGKSASLIGAPLTPMLAVAILAAGSALFGLIYRIPGGIGAWVATLLGFVPILLSLVMALILVGLALGWPLMHATVAAEGEDAPDALSRSYSYVNQRLGRYAVHVIAALVIGAVGLTAAVAFARIVLGLADWGVSLGSPDFAALSETARSGRWFWARVVGLVVEGWVYSYFWSAASILYLILRRDVDGTPWQDVYLPEHDLDTFAEGLKPEAPEPSPKPVEAEVG